VFAGVYSPFKVDHLAVYSESIPLLSGKTIDFEEIL